MDSSGKSSETLSGIETGILDRVTVFSFPGKSSETLSGIETNNLHGVLPWNITTGKSSETLSGIETCQRRA